MRVFEAPDQTADAILRLYGEQFILNNTEYDEEWLKDFNNPKKNKKAIEELEWWMQEDMDALKKLLKDVRSGKIPEGASQWLCYQVIPLRSFGTYECTHNSPIQLLIYPEDLDRAINTFNWYAQNRKDSTVQNKIREMFPEVNTGGRKIKNPLDWSIWEMEDIEAAMTPTSQAQQKNEAWMPETLGFSEDAAEVAFQDGDLMLVRLKNANAASRYASGTKWCTSNKGTANSYLRNGDLFVAVRNGNRIGQLHGHSNQIMDLQDRPMRDLPPSIARFMLKDELNELTKLADEWPTDQELKEKWKADRMAQLKGQVTEQENQLARALAIYEGNDIDEDSYSRFLIRRVFGTVDTTDIRSRLDRVTENYDEAVANPPEPSANDMSSMRSNSANRLANLVRSISNMTDRVPAQYRTADAMILPDATVNRIVTLANSTGVNIDVWQITSLVNDPSQDLRKAIVKQLRDTVDTAKRGGYTHGISNHLTRFMTLAIRTSGYDLDDFLPGSDALVREAMLVYSENPRYGTSFALDTDVGSVMTQIGRKETPDATVVWFLKQDAVFQDRIFPRLDNDQNNDVGNFVNFYATSSSSDPASSPTDFNQLAKLPDVSYGIVKSRLIAATPKLGPESLGNYSNNTEMKTVDAYMEAVTELIRRKEGDKEADAIAKDLASGAVDTSLIGRMQKWFRDSLLPDWVNNNSNRPLFAPSRQFFVDHGLALETVVDDGGERLSVTEIAMEGLDPLPSIRYWNVVGADSEGQKGGLPVVNLTETGDVFGDLMETVYADITNPTDSRLTPNGSNPNGYGGYLKAFLETNLPKEDRMIKQINAKQRARPPATLGFICTICQYPLELDPADGQWRHPVIDVDEIEAFAERWDWNTAFWPYNQSDRTRCLFPGVEGLPYNDKIRKQLPRAERKKKVMGVGFNYSYGYSSSGKQTEVIPMLDDHPHVPYISQGASVLICDLCTGIRPVPPDVGHTYSVDTTAWSMARANRPCKCGYTIRSLALYEAEDYEDYEPTEAEITEELTGALGSGGPRGLNQTAYEAEYTQISGDDMDSFLTDLGFTELPRRARTERIYDHVYGRGPNGDLVIRVYTSIIDGGGSAAARKVGADSIKVVPLYLDSTHGDIPLGKQKRVHRVTGWRDNLRSRIATAQEAAPGPVIDSSGKPMRLRRNKRTGDMFWGSIDFPNNRETRPYRG